MDALGLIGLSGGSSGGGGVPSIYMHTIDVGAGSGKAWFTTVVYTTDSTPFTADTFKAYLQTNFPTLHKGLPVSGGYPSYGVLTSVFYWATSGMLGVEYTSGTGTNNNGITDFNTSNFLDTVHQIV